VRTVNTNISTTTSSSDTANAATTIVRKRGRPTKVATADNSSNSSESIATQQQQQQFMWSPSVSGSGSSGGLRFIGQAPSVAPLHVQLAQSPRQVSAYMCLKFLHWLCATSSKTFLMFYHVPQCA
jgi:hypothetical protein